MSRFVILCFALIAACLLASAPCLPADAPVVKIHDGRHWIWYAQDDQYQAHKADIEAVYDYADRAFDALVAAWGIGPPSPTYALLVYPKPGGGFATGDIGEAHAVTGTPQPGIGCSFDAFFNVANGIKGYWAPVLITHEMVNLFTGQAVSGGWPVDWWADHVSPFPLMTAVQIEYQLRPDIAVHHAEQLSGPLEKMFVRLKDQFGWSMFRRAFAAARADRINWGAIGENPSSLLTNYVCAYLQLGAPEDLRPYFEGVVPGFNADDMADILAARKALDRLAENDPTRVALRDASCTGAITPAASNPSHGGYCHEAASDRDVSPAFARADDYIGARRR